MAAMRLTLLLLLAAARLAFAQAVVVDRIVAVVDGKAITRFTVEQRMKLMKLPYDEALDELVERELIARDAADTRLSVEDVDVDRALVEVMAQNKLDEAGFKQALKAQGFELASYRAELRSQLLRLRWIMLRASTTGRPNDEGRAAFMERERKRLLAELRTRFVVEVRK